MLVKLGNVWVDPIQVIFISCGKDHVSISVKEDGYVGAMTIASPESWEEAESLRDEYAAIINNAVGQSYGGGDEETKEGIR